MVFHQMGCTLLQTKFLGISLASDKVLSEALSSISFSFCLRWWTLLILTSPFSLLHCFSLIWNSSACFYARFPPNQPAGLCSKLPSLLYARVSLNGLYLVFPPSIFRALTLGISTISFSFWSCSLLILFFRRNKFSVTYDMDYGFFSRLSYTTFNWHCSSRSFGL